MTSEFRRCRTPSCWIPHLLDKGYKTLWPIVISPEQRSGMFAWSFYVKWTPTRGTHVNKALVCEEHHKQILHMFESAAEAERVEQEVTESWLVRTNSRM